MLERLSGWSDSPADIRRALTAGEIPASDRRVRFVGLDAYEAAGGAVRRDLFDQDGGGYALDEALLDRLVSEKLASFAGSIATEGWKWVEIVPVLSYEALSDYARRYPEPAALPEPDQAELDNLSAAYDELVDSDEADTERLAGIERRIDELNARAEAWPAETLAIAGAVVSLGHDGDIRIERGLVRSADEPKASPAGEDAGTATGAVSGLSAALIADLTAQKTAAIRCALTGQPDIALACIVHALALQTLYRGAGMATCLELRAQSPDLRSAMAKPDDSRALASFEAARERLTAQLPDNPAGLWDWCLAQPRESLLELLALCAAHAVNAVQRKDDRPICDRLANADMLASALKLDMTAWFTPGADNLFGRISRAGILAALREASGADPAPAWAKLKKAELAAIAARKVAGTGWLPEPLRLADHGNAQAEPAVPETDAA